MGGGVEGGGGEGEGGSGGGGGGGGGEGEGEGGGGGDGEGAHVADVMVPSELQMCVPAPACARMHRRLVCDGAWWRESLWCGCGGTVLGRGLVWRLGHGAWGHK